MLLWLAEKRIQEAIDRGDLDNYAGKGQPFPDEFWTENPYVPEDMKQTYKFLKGASFTPYVIELRKKIELLKIKARSKKLSLEEKKQLSCEISVSEMEFEIRMEFFKNS